MRRADPAARQERAGRAVVLAGAMTVVGLIAIAFAVWTYLRQPAESRCWLTRPHVARPLREWCRPTRNNQDLTRRDAPGFRSDQVRRRAAAVAAAAQFARRDAAQ